MTTLSIIIPSHNRPDLLRRCLDTVARHVPAGSEVIVVDDASPGGTVSTTAAGFVGVRIRRLPRRRGFCAAANTGIRAAGGDVVELLNDDTEVTRGWADAALAAFADPRVAAVAPLVLRWPGAGAEGPRIDSAGDRYYLGGVAGKRGHGEGLTAEYLRPGAVFGASGSSAFYRRDVLLQVGLFPEEFGAYFEDVDVAFRLHRAGYQVYYEPASQVLHRVGASHGRPGRRLLEQQSCNEERVFWRNLPAADLGRALPRHLAVLAAKAWRRGREGTLLPFLCGRLRLLAELPRLWDHRHRLRALGPDAPWAAWQVEDRWWGR
jgi:GT2 family glycosyltransferase